MASSTAASRDAEGMLGEVCPRILMQDGRGNVLLGRNKARKLGRGEVEVLRRVVQGGRLNDGVFVKPVFRRFLRRRERDAQRMFAAGGL